MKTAYATIGLGLAACAQLPAEDLELGEVQQAVMTPDDTVLGPSPYDDESYPLPSGGSCPPNPNRCFGAVGVQCSGLPPPFSTNGIIAGCTGSVCQISAGSWQHDECCASHPGGHMCGVGVGLFSNVCKPEWDLAVRRTSSGFNWKRSVSVCRIDNDGRVDFTEYCALAETRVHVNDSAYCCSRRVRNFDAAIDASKAVPNPQDWPAMRICMAAPTSNGGGSSSVPPKGPPPLRPCSSHEQCAPDGSCAYIAHPGPGYQPGNFCALF